MTDTLPAPPMRCPACGAGHYVAVRFCPFCGAAQDVRREAPEPSPPRAKAEPSPPIAEPETAPAIQPSEAEPPRPPKHAPSVAPSPIPPVPPAPRSKERPRRRGSVPLRTRFRLRSVILALLIIAGLATLALGRRDGLPAPTRVVAGPGWDAVALGPFRSAPLLRLTGDGPFSLRLDGERVLRVAPGGGASLRLRTLRSLELRAARGSVTVTLTPRGE